MALPFQITREDLLRSKLVTPGWHKSKVIRAEGGQASTDGSDIIKVELRLLGGDFDGVTILRTFSLKDNARHFAISFIEAVTAKSIGSDGGRFDFEKVIGVEIKTYVKNEEYKGRMVNKAEDFQAIS